MLNQYLEDKY